ncbi:MAG: UDP-N-acetylmuramate dehydrogenase [Chloroflexi bacterium]|nr:UDP-N-acetylmuramate dehydrogenase [Chloroflexota bacterium]
MNSSSFEALAALFGERVRRDEPLSRFTAARLGGPADVFLEVRSAQELAQAAAALWAAGCGFLVLGGGSNVLVSDRGVRGAVVLNKARRARFLVCEQPPCVWAESGANLGALARQAAVKGLAGLEWAAGIPGTLGGAVVGNAGAQGGDTAGSLLVAEILQRNSAMQENLPQRETWPVERLEYGYRASLLKRNPGEAVVLAAALRLETGDPQTIQARMDALVSRRKRTQPPGASMGSMFKNPPGDYAGRLIEAAGLKGVTLGGAAISDLHANFFINREQATASDIYALITLARRAVAAKMGVQLELEVELVGEWLEETRG